MAIWQAVYQMQSLLDKGSSAETTWKFFEETLYPRIVNIGGGKAVPRIILRRLYGNFFTHIVEEKAKDFTCSSLPSLELITHRMAELGALWNWTPLMIRLVDSIRKITPSQTGYPSPEDHEAAMVRRNTLVRDLQLAWGAFSMQGAFRGVPRPKSRPDNSQKAFADAFAALFPGYDKGVMYRPMWVALASYGLLTDPKLGFGVKDSAFVVMMRALVEGNALPFEEDHRTFAELCPPDLYAYMLVRLWVGINSEESRRGSRARRKSESTPTSPSEGSFMPTRPSPQSQWAQTAWGSKGSSDGRPGHFARSSQSEWGRLGKEAGMAQPRQATQKGPATYRTLEVSSVQVQASRSSLESKSSTGDHLDQHSPADSLVDVEKPAQVPRPDEIQPGQGVESQAPQTSQGVLESKPEIAVAEQTTPTSRQDEIETSQPSHEVQTTQTAQNEAGQLSEGSPTQPPLLTENQSDLKPDKKIRFAQTDEADQPSSTAVAGPSHTVQEAKGSQEPQTPHKRQPSPSVATSRPTQVPAPVIQRTPASQTPKSAHTQQVNPAHNTGPASHQSNVSKEPVRRHEIRRLDVSEFTHEHAGSRIHKQMGQAIRARNTKLLDRAWDEFWGEEAEPSAAQIKKLGEMMDLFDYFIVGYTELRKPNRAIFVWNAMLQVGLKPTIKTWTAMIQGCAKSGNPQGIKLVWSRLIASGMQLDTPIWTARISGLIISGDLAGGIEALNEMADIWKNRDAPGNAAIAVKPSIGPVNATLGWLLRLERNATAETLLQWAARQDIQPDIFTFNTLLRPLVREGNTVEMNRLFDGMQQVGVRPDVTTYTILLDGALAGIADMTADEQTAAVSRVISDMERAGVEANMMAYAKIIYNLLLDGNTNAGDAVRAVISHIWSRGLELSSHIYTILAEHYFSRDPPDAAAVTHLISSRRLAVNPKIDRVFWERVIKGYCQAGEVQRAVKIFEHVCGMGSTITFSTLYDFLNALATSGMMGEARKVVRVARKLTAAEEPEEYQPVIVGPRPTKRFWKHRFWHLADAYGLLEEGLLEEYLEVRTGAGIRA